MADANLAASKLRQQGADLLVVRRQIRSSKDKEDSPNQTVVVLSHVEGSKLLAQGGGDSLLILPIGPLFAELNERIEIPPGR
jgi:hypothetical protein